eukprot:scaffold206590_cov16-Tisochrysis_lutea.AAC.1
MRNTKGGKALAPSLYALKDAQWLCANIWSLSQTDVTCDSSLYATARILSTQCRCVANKQCHTGSICLISGR